MEGSKETQIILTSWCAKHTIKPFLRWLNCVKTRNLEMPLLLRTYVRGKSKIEMDKLNAEKICCSHISADVYVEFCEISL